LFERFRDLIGRQRGDAPTLRPLFVDEPGLPAPQYGVA
jgi:hypothetical protein